MCKPSFTGTIEISCLLSVATAIRTGKVAQTPFKYLEESLWMAGCATRKFAGGEVEPAPIPSIFGDNVASMTSETGNDFAEWEALADQFEEHADNATHVMMSDGSKPELGMHGSPVVAINPETLALLLAFAQKILEKFLK